MFIDLLFFFYFKVGESVEMHCDAQEAEGTQKPSIQWQRVRPNKKKKSETKFCLQIVD